MAIKSIALSEKNVKLNSKVKGKRKSEICMLRPRAEVYVCLLCLLWMDREHA
jgi:hypothetical protein